MARTDVQELIRVARGSGVPEARRLADFVSDMLDDDKLEGVLTSMDLLVDWAKGFKLAAEQPIKSKRLTLDARKKLIDCITGQAEDWDLETLVGWVRAEMEFKLR